MYTDAPSSQNFPGDGSSSQGPTLFVELVDAQGNALQAVPLNERGVTVGSAPGNVLLIDSPAVARFHVRINWDGQYASILNLATRKPTLFGGGPLQANELRFWQPGEILQIGDSRLRLQVGTVPVQQQHSSDAPVTMPLGALPALINDGHLDIQLDSGYDMVDLTPEQATIVKLTLINRGSTPETVTVGLEGPAAGWLRTPQAPIQIRPGAQIGHTLQIMVPRKPENRAGEYEVLIRMISQTNIGLSVTTTGHWTVLPFSDAKLEVRPPILKVRSMNSGIYTVALRNLGNASMPFEIRISDDQQSLEFAPITASGVLEPGAIDERKIEVQPIREPDDKEQTYNVRVQAFANAQTYTDNASLIQKRAMFPPWVIPLAISAVVLLLVAGAALWTRQARANQNNQNATQVAAITQTVENMRLTDSERQGTALAASTQTPLAMTLEAINSNGIMGPTATILSQMNGTQIAAAAQITVQAAMIRTMQAGGGNPNGGQFFGGSGPNDPAQQTAAAAQQTAAAASNQLAALQTTVAQQGQTAATSAAGGSGSGSGSDSGGGSSGDQATQAAGNSQATQAASNTQATQAANAQQTSAAQTAAAQTSTAQAAQTASAAAQQTSVVQTAAAQLTQTAAAQQTINAVNTANAVAQLTSVAQQTANAIATQTATAIIAKQPDRLQLTNGTIRKKANETFDITVQVIDKEGNNYTGNNPLISVRLQTTSVEIEGPFLSANPTNGRVTITGLQIKKAGVYDLYVVGPPNSTLTPPGESNRVRVEIAPGPVKSVVFECFLYRDQQQCQGATSLKTTERWGFVATLRDEYNNIVTDASPKSIVLYNLDGRGADPIEINNPPDFDKGTLTVRSQNFPDNFGPGMLYVSVGVQNQNTLFDISDLFPLNTGDPSKVIQEAPQGTSFGSPQNVPNAGNPVVFKVKVQDSKQNLIRSGKICFIARLFPLGPEGSFQTPDGTWQNAANGISIDIDSATGVATSYPMLPVSSSPKNQTYLLYAIATDQCSPDIFPVLGNPSSPHTIFYIANN